MAGAAPVAADPVVLGSGQVLFPLEDNVYLTTNFFRGRAYIHVRKFRLKQTPGGLRAEPGGGHWYNPVVVSKLLRIFLFFEDNFWKNYLSFFKV